MIGAFYSPIYTLSLWLLFGLLVLPSPAGAQPILPNGSFEDTSASWMLAGGAAWSSVSARTGKYGLSTRTSKAVRVANSAPVAVSVEQSYRLTGYIRAASGRARLGMDVMNGTGKILETVATPWVNSAREWRFTAVERDMPSGTASVRVWVEAQGRAHIDDLVLAPMKANMVYNPTFDADNRGRVSMWIEEPADLQAGKRAGAMKGDPNG
ncbi:MAG TPA: hypothetical protein VNJ09_02200, partial [Chthonomonadales bacterium]|nr:hypothetical protein [Chthonomonadales bacterium]